MMSPSKIEFQKGRFDSSAYLHKGIYQIHGIDLLTDLKDKENVRKRILDMGENIAKDLDLKTIIIDGYSGKELYFNKGYSPLNMWQKNKFTIWDGLRFQEGLEDYLIKKIK